MPYEHHALLEMLDELETQRLEVVLIPQPDPANPGACLRAVAAVNPAWYRRICAAFESRRKRHYRKFKTKVKRAEIRRVLAALCEKKTTQSIYAKWLLNEAARRYNQIPF